MGLGRHDVHASGVDRSARGDHLGSGPARAIRWTYDRAGRPALTTSGNAAGDPRPPLRRRRPRRGRLRQGARTAGGPRSGVVMSRLRNRRLPLIVLIAATALLVASI